MKKNLWRPMEKTDLSCLKVFQTLSHKQFDIIAYREQFLKTFLQLSQHCCKSSVSRKKKMALASGFYKALFSGKSGEVDKVLREIAPHIKPSQTLEHFLSNLFFTFIAAYSKSLYGTNARWGKLQKVVSAVDTLMAYTQSIQSTPKSEVLEILPEDLAISLLEKMRQQEKPVRVLNTYCGVPIQYDAMVIHTTANSVVIKTHILQETAASLQGGIYILKNGDIPDLYATVRPLVMEGVDYLELTRFEQLSSSLHKRQSVRVYPMERINVPFSHGGRNVQTTLFDISIGGIALISRAKLPVNAGEEIFITIPAALLESPVTIESKLIHVSVYEGGFKYHFQIDPDPAQESIISKLIIKRQNEIIKSLKAKLL